jgi:hypothetical protein
MKEGQQNYIGKKDRCKYVLYGFGRIMAYANWYSENKDSIILSLIAKEARSLKDNYSDEPVSYVNRFLKENNSGKRMPKDFNILLGKAASKKEITDISKKDLKRLGKQFYNTLVAVNEVETH